MAISDLTDQEIDDFQEARTLLLKLLSELDNGIIGNARNALTTYDEWDERTHDGDPEADPPIPTGDLNAAALGPLRRMTNGGVRADINQCINNLRTVVEKLEEAVTADAAKGTPYNILPNTAAGMVEPE